ncbi:hypothetical protein V1294_004698 [Bradyrhizobium sp. AZCC 1678]|uniref:Lipoprotein n=1 Tax=Bradyrhizobium algeriense TaxID=634784 RepID=A0ABU8B9R3_9BRAD
MFRLFAFLLSTLLVLAGCTIRPLPEDVTGVTTPQIVMRIRCETRDAVIEHLVNWLEDLGRDYPGRPGVALGRELAAKYRANPNEIREFRADLFKGPQYEQVRNLIEVFYAIGVAYNFDLTMTVDNDLSAGSANLQRTAAGSVFKLGLGASMTRRRSNDRTFTITDTFSSLLTQLNVRVWADGHRECDGHVVQENHIYPIVGQIGVTKLVYDYLELTIFGGLAGTKSTPSLPPTMADKLTFTTTLDASATPKITFTPTGTAFQLTDAAITGELKRTDVHEVTMGLALPTNASAYLSSLRSFIFSPARNIAVDNRSARPGRKETTTSVVLGARVSGGGTPAEAMAVYAVDQLKSRQFQLVPTP